MLFIEIFLAFFIPGIIGYGGGPASIPLIQAEVVDRFQWVTVEEFGELLAIGNALPGPIATKMAGYIGYEVGGAFGSFVALFAIVAPSLIAMLFLLGLLYKFKDSPRVKRMTALIKPSIAILLGMLAFQFFSTSYFGAGIIQTLVIAIVSLLLLEKFKVHPALVIVSALIYGAVFLA